MTSASAPAALAPTCLSERAVLSLSGPDTIDLLQGLVTANVANLGEGEVVHAALLTPQGKVLSAFFVWRTADGVLLDLPGEEAVSLQQRLNLYRLRAKVEIAPSDLGVWVGDDGPPAARPDPRLAAMGKRWLAPPAAAAGDAQSNPYDERRLDLGMPEFTYDYEPNAVFPMDVNLDRLGAIDYKKGCFVGQEVASRMFRKGEVRKRSWRVDADGTLEAGAEIVAGSSTLGSVTSAAGMRGIALVRVDRVAAAESLPTIDGAPVRLTAPDYLA